MTWSKRGGHASDMKCIAHILALFVIAPRSNSFPIHSGNAPTTTATTAFIIPNNHLGGAQHMPNRAIRNDYVRSILTNSSSDEESTITLTGKGEFLQSLEKDFQLNGASSERTNLLNQMIDRKIVVTPENLKKSNHASTSLGDYSIENPGRSFQTVAPGTWKVIYAPHMTTMAGLGGGEFDVQYTLNEDGTMVSHAKYNFPWLRQQGYLSVSGTYGSVSDIVCRVDFDETWVRQLSLPSDGILDDNYDNAPYQNIASVPDSVSKSLIQTVGRSFFIDGVSVFPVSYLDDDLIVFDFELLGTRICARKMN